MFSTKRDACSWSNTFSCFTHWPVARALLSQEILDRTLFSPGEDVVAMGKGTAPNKIPNSKVFSMMGVKFQENLGNL